jgi:hypothetical protein
MCTCVNTIRQRRLAVTECATRHPDQASEPRWNVHTVNKQWVRPLKCCDGLRTGVHVWERVRMRVYVHVYVDVGV